MKRAARVKILRNVLSSQNDAKAEEKNSSNEKILNKTINRIIKPKKIRPINTHKLLTCMPDENYVEY